VCRYNWHSAGDLGQAISDAEILIYFSKKIYGSNFIEQHSELLWFEISKMLIGLKKLLSHLL